MNGLLAFLSLLLCGLIVVAVPHMVAPDGVYGAITISYTSRAILLCAVLATVAGFAAYRQGVNGSFLLKLFIAGLLVRMVVGTAIFVFNWQDFFGGDALTYDFNGYYQLLAWGGDKYAKTVVFQFVGSGQGSGWGMVYLVAAVYGLIGRNPLAVQLVNSVMGAATAFIIFLCAYQVFNNIRVARVAGIAVAFYPSLV